MASDAYLLQSADDQDICPTLRIYDWDQPTLTIGYHQHLENALDASLLGETPVIRRTTGGRALLHNDRSLTYAVAGNFIASPELGLTIGESYREISHSILLFYHSIGIEARMSQRDRPVSLSGKRGLQKDCFSAVSRWEITFNGCKLAAGSQRRTKRTIMQHGVISISSPGDHPALNRSPQHYDRHDFPRVSMARSDLLLSLCDSFSRHFGIRLDSQPFDEEEIRIIERLLDSHRNLNLGSKLIEQ